VCRERFRPSLLATWTTPWPNREPLPRVRWCSTHSISDGSHQRRWLVRHDEQEVERERERERARQFSSSSSSSHSAPRFNTFLPPLSLHGQRTLCVCVGSSSTVRPFLYTPNILDGKIQDNEVTDTHTRKRLTRSSHDFYIFSKIFPTKNTMRIIILYFGVSCVEIHTQRERAPVKLRDTSSSSPPPHRKKRNGFVCAGFATGDGGERPLLIASV
jgi:hypothetical protein